MTHWRAMLRMRSPLATPLTAERLFGHVCWGLAWREGPEAVADFLSRMAGESPPLVIGEPMPAGFAPMPVVLRTQQVRVEPGAKRQATWDLYQRCGRIPAEALYRAAGDFSAGGLLDALHASGWPRPLLARRQVRLRSEASRAHAGPSGRSDWLAVETWPDDETVHLEVPVAGNAAADEVERLLRMGLENGIGRSANVGYGQVELVALETVSDWPAPADANALVTLGPCVPRADDPAGGWWELASRWGKLGGAYGAQTTAPDKQPVLVLEAGAVLTAPPGERSKTERTFVGRLVGGVHPERPEVVHYGMAPVLAVKLHVEA